jgi:hypothetical protein
MFVLLFFPKKKKIECHRHHTTSRSCGIDSRYKAKAVSTEHLHRTQTSSLSEKKRTFTTFDMGVRDEEDRRVTCWSE